MAWQSVEEDAHSHIEEFTGQIEGRCGELRKSVEEEQEQRALIEQRHAQRMEDLKTLEVSPIIHDGVSLDQLQ